MSKISKFIICCLAVIISICSFVVPTYCSENFIYPPSESFNISNFQSISNDNFLFYNSNNSNYVEVNNVRLSRKIGVYFAFYTNTPLSYTSDIESEYSFGSFYKGDIVYYFGNVREVWRISLVSQSSSQYQYQISLIDYNYQLNDIIPYSLYLNERIPGTSWGLNLSYDIIPRSILQIMRGHVLDWFFLNIEDNISYDFDFNNQYFYNECFAFPTPFSLFDYCNTSIYPTNSIHYYLTKGSKYTYSLTDIHNNVFNQVVNYSFLDNYSSLTDYDSYTIFKNNYNSNNSYLKSVSISCKYYNFDGGSYQGLIVPDNIFNSLVAQSSHGIFNGGDSFYFYQSFNDNISNYTSLIPNGSNNFYKTAEWWDIPSHLYNFFIYLIFDAPIISNFTNLVMVIINFIVEVFGFFIGLFNGINNIFFISIFIGIIVLIFLLKIIFKG